MEDEELEAIRVRADAATEGPWRCGSKVGRTVYDGYGPDDLIGVMDNRVDAVFVAHARTDVPKLLAEIERLHTWDGLISILDEHYPPDLVDGSSNDPGPRIVALAREIDRLRKEQ